MIVYTVDDGEYITMEESLRRQPQGKRNMYVNLTNRCTCACTFCLRNLKEMAKDMTLWLTKEPTVPEVKAALAAAPWGSVREVVFCGFGEPTMRLADLQELLGYVKETHPGLATRLNTNGLSDLEYGRDTAAGFQGILDTISISLNASNAERYLELTRSKFGIGSYAAMLSFAQHCQQYVPQVVLTIVDHVEGADEIASCRRLCEERGLKLRVRPYEAK
jgi:TatD family-associated radical SAM protein